MRRASASFAPIGACVSGVQPEPWHFSFAPVAESAAPRLSPQVLQDGHCRGAADWARTWCWSSLEELHARYVAAIDLAC